MEKMALEVIHLLGIALPAKTTNENGQSMIDCGSLWQKFEQGDYTSKIPGKISDEILAVYYAYEGDHTKPFSYFIGCRVKQGTPAPEGLSPLIIPKGTYQKMIASGKMPDCIANAWMEIWSSNIPRAYAYDFEVYDERSRDWSNAVVDIFISVNE
jgi:predicted transcriptional regulator YdeE